MDFTKIGYKAKIRKYGIVSLRILQEDIVQTITEIPVWKDLIMFRI